MSEEFKAIIEVELDKATYNQADLLIKQIAKTHRIDLDSGEFNKKLDDLNKKLTSVDSLIDSINNKKLALGGAGNSSVNIGFDPKQLKKMTNAFGTLNATIKTIQQSLGGLGKNSGLGTVAQDLSDAAKKIGDAFDKINNSSDLTQLNQNLNNLGGNLTRIERLLNGLGGQANLQNLAQSFRDLSVEINQAMSACINVRTALNNGRNAISEMDNVTIDASQHVNALETAMRGLNINQNEIDEATQRLRDMDITVLTVTRHIQELANDGQAVDFTIRGVDQHGQAVTATQRYRRTLNDDGSYDDTMRQDLRITQTVGNTAEEINEVADAYDNMVRARRRMAQAAKEQIGKDPLFDANDIADAQQKYQAAHAEYQRLSSQYWHRFTQDQQRSLRELRQNSADAISQTTAKALDKQYKQEFNEAAKSIEQVLSKQEEIERLTSKRNSFGIDIEVWAKENSDAARVFAGQLTDIKTRLQDCDAQTLSHLKDEFIEVQKTADFQGFVSNADLEKNSENITKSLEKIKEQTKETKDALASFNSAKDALGKLDSQSSDTQRIAATNAYREALKKLEQQIKENIQAESTSAKNDKLKFKKDAFSAQIDVWSNKNSKAAEYYKDRIEEIRVKLQDCDEVELANLRTQWTTLTREAQAAGKTVKSFGDEVKGLATRLVGYFTLDNLVDRATDAIRDMYQQVLEIDTAMTDLLKVTDETSQRYQEFMKNASGSAKELGRSMSGYITQAAEWSKMGYSIDEAEALSKVSSIYANVGDVDDATAVSDLVTTMKAYGMAADDALHIVDALNNVSNNFATTAKGLGEGLTNSASAMAMSNTTFEQTIALLTGISEITQSPAEAGSFLKVASMRIRGMKGELEALGEEVDSNVDSISKVQTQILNLTHGKVNIFDSTGEFRNYYEIMQDIAKVYKELTSTEQADLTEILSGKMRGNQGAAIIQAFQSGQIEKAFTAASESAGSAMAEQEKWMESLEARIGKLTAAWQSFSESVLSSDFLKLLIDGATGFLDILEKAVDTFGALPTLITSVVAGLSAFKNVGERMNQFRSEIHIGTRICPRNLLLMVT